MTEGQANNAPMLGIEFIQFSVVIWGEISTRREDNCDWRKFLHPSIIILNFLIKVLYSEMNLQNL